MFQIPLFMAQRVPLQRRRFCDESTLQPAANISIFGEKEGAPAGRHFFLAA